ncbi:MAG TPA: T9SS type A sorting domain-containing protein, partial [Mariniphaga sp.]|nr:T9SS type A sorting domain-containing protein [Mariniphaga sp.]
TSVYSGVPVTTFDPGTMDYYTQYFWRVNETDGTGTYVGPVWSFRTELDPNSPLLVVPFDYTNVPGTATFLGPLYTGARTYQLLIHEDLLTSLVDKEIQGLSWRIPPSAASDWPPSDVTITDYNIYLSGSVHPADRDLSNFAANVVGNQVQVKSGSLYIPANSYTHGNAPNEFGPEIPFDSNYLYTGGHLLIEIRQSGTGNSQGTDAVGTTTPGYGTLFSACWGNGMTANSGNQGNFSIVRLSATVIPVELASFTASIIDGKVNLKWQTASETNNYGFEVERKTAGQNFTKVGFVAGYGTTTELKNYNFVDNSVTSGKYIYRLKQVDFDGTFEYSKEVEVEVNPMPAVYSLAQNYPNPFNPTTKIEFSLAVESKVTLKIFDVLGQEVATLINENLDSGIHNINFDASAINSGVYFYRIEATGIDGTNFTSTKKMMLTK